MKRLFAALALLALAAGAQAQEGRGDRGGPRGGGQMRGYANPSAAIAAEIALARAAQDKGQWTAARAAAAPDAAMFAPAMVLAHDWLKNRPDPPAALARQPYQVWSSCDGSLMITSGAWQRGDSHGWFTTVWQRQAKGGYKWVFDHHGAAREPLPAPEMIAARVAACPERRPGPRPAGQDARGKPAKREKTPPMPFDPTRREGRSDDGTLAWQVTADTAGTHDFTARMLVDGQMEEIRNEHVAAGA
ncbi:MAG: hypothetical protein WCY29_17510 [Novosphingobium sp.]